MDKFVVVGARQLTGEVNLQGSKNAALPILAATLLIDQPGVTLRNIPRLADIETMLLVLGHLGVRTSWDKKTGLVTLDASGSSGWQAPYDMVRKMRASFLVMGPLLARLGRARVSLPGGCVLGPRPVDYHLMGFARLGAKIVEDQGYVEAQAPDGLRGAVIHFDRPSHTGTENIIMAACLAKGKTTIVNAACDPEVVDLANFLNSAGAKIRGAGTPFVEVEGVSRLKAIEYEVMPDRLEAGTFMMAVAACGGDILIKPPCHQYLGIVIDRLVHAGIEIKTNGGGMRVAVRRRPAAFDIVTYPYPGFPTDLQASAMALACICDGVSHIKETVFTERFTHVMELIRLGADIKTAGEEAVIRGVENLKGASVMASDIRAGAGLVVATLAARGESEIRRVYHIDRGYEGIEMKLQALGANIARVPA